MAGKTETRNSRAMSGIEFADADVVRSYVHRTNYPDSLFKRLLDLSKGRHRALDLGCGPGQFARWLAPHFATVLAVDPSLAMLTLAKKLMLVHIRISNGSTCGQRTRSLATLSTLSWPAPASIGWIQLRYSRGWPMH